MPSRRPNPPAGNADWQDRAACRGHDPELWFPKPVNPYTTRQEQREENARRAEQEARALAICRVCPVRAECFQWAVETDSGGVWGGTTEAERGHTPTR